MASAVVSAFLPSRHTSWGHSTSAARRLPGTIVRASPIAIESAPPGADEHRASTTFCARRESLPQCQDATPVNARESSCRLTLAASQADASGLLGPALASAARPSTHAEAAFAFCGVASSSCCGDQVISGGWKCALPDGRGGLISRAACCAASIASTTSPCALQRAIG